MVSTKSHDKIRFFIIVFFSFAYCGCGYVSPRAGARTKYPRGVRAAPMPGGPVRTGSQTRCVLIRIVRHLPLGFVCCSCVLQQRRNRFILKRLIQIRLDVRVTAVHRARRRSVAGAVTVVLQTAVDPRRALHQIDDLVQRDLLRRAPQRKAAVRPVHRMPARRRGFASTVIYSRGIAIAVLMSAAVATLPSIARYSVMRMA